uniref:Capsid protein n=1 Tax=Beihai hepe-like virus 7 TaxID=1922384 RepID=A0A1L3KJJ4_9VIRU|nr:hypothetical protein [Beihai hepe-like virus 7]
MDSKTASDNKQKVTVNEQSSSNSTPFKSNVSPLVKDVQMHKSYGGTQKIEDGVHGSGIVAGGTSANSVYYFRTPKTDIALTTGDTPGKPLYTVNLDIDIDPTVQALAKQFQTYRFKALKLELVCNSPFGTASGSVVVGHVPDPSNTLPSTAKDALALATRLTGSRVVTPRDSSTIEPNLGAEFKWCKKATYPRAESFGQMFVIVRQAPGMDSVAQWNLTISGTVEFLGATVNSDTTTVVEDIPSTDFETSKISIAKIDGHNDWFIGLPVKGVNKSGLAQFTQTFRIELVLTDDSKDEEYYSFLIASGDILKEQNQTGGFWLLIPTAIRDSTNLNSPVLKSATLSPTPARLYYTAAQAKLTSKFFNHINTAEAVKPTPHYQPMRPMTAIFSPI